SNTWNAGAAPMPVGITGMAAAAVGSTVYIIGGDSEGSACTRRVLAYDISHERWSYRDSLSTPRCGAAAAALGGRVFVIGGHYFKPCAEQCHGDVRCWDAYHVTLSSVESYDPATNRWTREPDLPVPAYGMVAVATRGDGRLFAFGGYSHEHRALRDVLTLEPR